MTQFLAAFPGFVEGTEGGLAVETLNANFSDAEFTRRWATRSVGMGSVLTGMYFGRRLGENLAGNVESVIGVGATGFIPAVAIGTAMTYHAVRENRPDQLIRRVRTIDQFPLILSSCVAAFEGVEAGILSGSGGAKLGEVVLTTSAGYLAGSSLSAGINKLAKRVTKHHAMSAARSAAVIPATIIAGLSMPEFVSEPSLKGAAVGALGALALTSALLTNLAPFVESFEKPKTVIEKFFSVFRRSHKV